MNCSGAVLLKKNKEKLPRNYHPWIFSGAVAVLEGSPKAGDIVSVYTHDRTFIAYGQWNPSSAIVARLMEWDEGACIDDAWYADKIRKALALRTGIITRGTDCYRLIFSEADGLPGFIADRLGDVVVLQALTHGAERVKAKLAAMLLEALPACKAVFEKSDGDGRTMEGLSETSGLAAGLMPRDELIVTENGLRFYADIYSQKTGFYCDQRDNRSFVSQLVTEGAEVLDCFSYSGGFGIYALARGARNVTLCDSSESALSLARKNIALNGIAHAAVSSLCGNAFHILRDIAKQGKKFDLVVIDPPKLAPNKKDITKALRAYKDLAMHGMRVTKSGGHLALFSCSGLISADEFARAVAWAAKDVGTNPRIIKKLRQSSCHPVSVFFPESEYMQGLVCAIP